MNLEPDVDPWLIKFIMMVFDVSFAGNVIGRVRQTPPGNELDPFLYLND
jgi:hypothetical protein